MCDPENSYTLIDCILKQPINRCQSLLVPVHIADKLRLFRDIRSQEVQHDTVELVQGFSAVIAKPLHRSIQRSTRCKIELISFYCSDILPPLLLTLRSGGFLFDSPIGLSISRLSPRAPRFSEQPFRAGCLFLFPYAVIRSLRPSSRIFTAAFTSLSIQFPHPQ